MLCFARGTANGRAGHSVGRRRAAAYGALYKRHSNQWPSRDGNMPGSRPRGSAGKMRYVDCEPRCSDAIRSTVFARSRVAARTWSLSRHRRKSLRVSEPPANPSQLISPQLPQREFAPTTNDCACTAPVSQRTVALGKFQTGPNIEGAMRRATHLRREESRPEVAATGAPG